MQIIQLYIEGQRVDMFKDESVNITQSIQNVKDIAKIFTDFTKTFSIPASPTNNKIFKHYYNFSIQGGFDARTKKDAFIELNSLPFRNGKIKLEGVDLKDNKAHTYKITFFGSTVELKDVLGEDKLSNLNFTEFDLDYDAGTVKQKLQATESSTNHIVAPLITHSQRLFYDSDQNNETPNDGNLHWHSGGGNHIHGVKWNELKYAIRVNKIIEAIETKYSLQFSSDFFKNTSVTEFDKLFLWLHRKSGKVEDLSGETGKVETLVNGWDADVSPPFEMETNGDFFIDEYEEDYIRKLELTITPQDVNQKYDVRIEVNDVSIYTKTNHTGNLIVTKNDFQYSRGFYNVYVSAVGTMAFTNIKWVGEYEDPSGDPPIIVNYNTGVFTTGASFRFNVNKQMPDIKVLDFLTGLFKLFNLTAYVDNDTNQIIVKNLNDFYDTFNTYDITKYIDVNSSKVNVALPFKEIIFKFKDTKSFLANKYGEIENGDWGKLSYNDDTGNLSGELYKVEVPFGHMLFERLTDVNTGDDKDIQWGYSVNNSQNAYLGSPLLFYPINENTGGISFVNAVDLENVGTGHERLFNINLPSNTNSFSSATNPSQLNFGLEVNEWTGDSTFSDTLFKKYYQDYIQSVFNTTNRITKVTAYLPMRILMNYTLADRFVINGNSYKINTINTNLETGKSELELLNDL